MSTMRTFGVLCSWLTWVSGCAFQSAPEPSGEADVSDVRTDALRRASTQRPAPTPTSAATRPSATQLSATPSSVCGVGVTLVPTVTPPGYKLSTIVVGTTTMLALVPDGTAPSVSLPAGYRVECQTASDGERFVELIPPSSPTTVVYPGGMCGVVNQQGVFLQCVAGSGCSSAGNNQPGICQPYPSAPTNQL